MTVKRLLRKFILNIKCHYAKMLCVSLYCLLTTGCGKKIQNSDPKEDKKLPLYSSSVDIKAKFYKNGLSEMGSAIVTNDAWVTIPGKLQVLAGNGGNQKARLYFNVKDGEPEFYCEYKGGASTNYPLNNEEIAKGLNYHLENCFQDIDQDGHPELLNYDEGTEVPQDANNQIVLEILGADDREDNVTRASIDVQFL